MVLQHAKQQQLPHAAAINSAGKWEFVEELLMHICILMQGKGISRCARGCVGVGVRVCVCVLHDWTSQSEGGSTHQRFLAVAFVPPLVVANG